MDKKESKFYLKNGTPIIFKKGLIVVDLGKDTISEETLKNLVKEGFLREESELTSKTADDYLSEVIERLRLPIEDVSDFLLGTTTISKGILLEYILALVVENLERNYDDYLEEYEEVYAINLYNGEIYKVDSDKIRSYETYPFFRNKKDAETALNVIKPLLKAAFEYNEEKQEDKKCD